MTSGHTMKAKRSDISPVPNPIILDIKGTTFASITSGPSMRLHPK